MPESIVPVLAKTSPKRSFSLFSHRKRAFWACFREYWDYKFGHGSRDTVEFYYLDQGFGTGSGSAWIRINLSCWIRIRIQIADPDPGGQKLPKKIEKRTELLSFEVLDDLF